MPTARALRHPAFEELDVVRTRAAVSIDGRILPTGSIGTIVLVHRDGVFEVEFADPEGTLVTLEAADIEPR